MSPNHSPFPLNQHFISKIHQLHLSSSASHPHNYFPQIHYQLRTSLRQLLMVANMIFMCVIWGCCECHFANGVLCFGSIHFGVPVIEP